MKRHEPALSNNKNNIMTSKADEQKKMILRLNILIMTIRKTIKNIRRAWNCKLGSKIIFIR